MLLVSSEGGLRYGDIGGQAVLLMSGIVEAKPLSTWRGCIASLAKPVSLRREL